MEYAERKDKESYWRKNPQMWERTKKATDERIHKCEASILLK